MTPEQVRGFQKAIGEATWKLDLLRFAEAVGQDHRHQHTQEMFRALTSASKAVNRFDAETLAKILNAGKVSSNND